MLKHQPCCRALLAKKQNKKIIHKNLVPVLFPLKCQGLGLGGAPRAPCSAGWPGHLWQSHGCSGLVWGQLTFLPVLLSRPIPSHRTPWLAGQGTHWLSHVLASLWYPGAAEAEASTSHLRRSRRSGKGQKMPCKE